MNDMADLLPNKLRMTADIEDMAGRPFTAGQLREAADYIEVLERDLSIEIDAGRDTVKRAVPAVHHAVDRLIALRETETELRAANQRIADLERDLSIEIDAGHDSTERAEAAEAERDELRAKWQPLVKWAAAKDKAGEGEDMMATKKEKPCRRCGGSGWLEPIGPYEDGSYITSRLCPRCHGDGEFREALSGKGES